MKSYKVPKDLFFSLLPAFFLFFSSYSILGWAVVLWNPSCPVLGIILVALVAFLWGGFALRYGWLRVSRDNREKKKNDSRPEAGFMGYWSASFVGLAFAWFVWDLTGSVWLWSVRTKLDREGRGVTMPISEKVKDEENGVYYLSQAASLVYDDLQKRAHFDFYKKQDRKDFLVSFNEHISNDKVDPAEVGAAEVLIDHYQEAVDSYEKAAVCSKWDWGLDWSGWVYQETDKMPRLAPRFVFRRLWWAKTYLDLKNEHYDLADRDIREEMEICSQMVKVPLAICVLDGEYEKQKFLKEIGPHLLGTRIQPDLRHWPDFFNGRTSVRCFNAALKTETLGSLWMTGKYSIANLSKTLQFNHLNIYELMGSDWVDKSCWRAVAFVYFPFFKWDLGRTELIAWKEGVNFEPPFSKFLVGRLKDEGRIAYELSPEEADDLGNWDSYFKTVLTRVDDLKRFKLNVMAHHFREGKNRWPVSIDELFPFSSDPDDFVDSMFGKPFEIISRKGHFEIVENEYSVRESERRVTPRFLRAD